MRTPSRIPPLSIIWAIAGKVGGRCNQPAPGSTERQPPRTVPVVVNALWFIGDADAGNAISLGRIPAEQRMRHLQRFKHFLAKKLGDRLARNLMHNLCQ